MAPTFIEKPSKGLVINDLEGNEPAHEDLTISEQIASQEINTAIHLTPNCEQRTPRRDLNQQGQSSHGEQRTPRSEGQ